MSQKPEQRPITRRRLTRLAGVLALRQPDLTVVLENVHDPHNVSAVLRSCDAVGAASAHLVYDESQEAPELSKGVAASAHRWLDIHRHQEIDSCYDQLRAQGMMIYATYLGEGAVDLYDLDLTRPSAFVFGNESIGVSEAARDGADRRLIIPMMGMVDSLNISVAAAVTLYEVLRQRRAAGMYDSPAWSHPEMRARLKAWLARDRRDQALAEGVDFNTVRPPRAVSRRSRTID